MPPVCLPRGGHVSPRPQVATVTGWGRTGVETTAPMSRALLVTQVYSDAVVSLLLLGHVNNQSNVTNKKLSAILVIFMALQGY